MFYCISYSYRQLLEGRTLHRKFLSFVGSDRLQHPIDFDFADLKEAVERRGLTGNLLMLKEHDGNEQPKI